MYYVRIKAQLEARDEAKRSQLQERIDAEYYSPDALEAEGKLVSYGNFKGFEKLVESGYRVVYHGIDSVSNLHESQTVIFVSPRDIDDSGSISFETATRVPQYYLDEYPKGIAEAGELLIEVKGNVSKLAVVPEYLPNGLLISGSLYKAKLKTDYDSWFVMSFLKSSIGQVLKKRLTSNTIINFITKDELYSLPIALTHKTVQTYIGDKVRQAERLRERSKSLEYNAKLLLDASLNWTKELESKSIYRRVKVAELDHRLDLNFNSPNKLQLFEYLREHKVTLEPLAKLAEISAMIGWKGLTTEYYTNHGPWLLRGVEFSNGLIDFDSLVSIKQHKYDEQPQIHLLEGDIALTKDGTIGRAIVIPKLTNELAAGSTVARLRIHSDCQANAYYLEYVLNHPVVQIQIMSFASGIAQPHITQEWIARLQIPRCEYEDKIGNFVFEHHQAVTYASYLTTAAKFL